MRITLVSPYDPRPPPGPDPQGLRGGVEMALDRSARGLARRGHDVTLVASAPRASQTRDDDGVRVIRVRRRGTLFRNPIAALWRHVPDDAEVVHVPATYPFVSDLIPWLGGARRPVVVEHHFDVAGTSPLMRAAALLHRATLGRGELRAARIITKSRDYARHSPTLSRVPPAKLDWVPNGVDLARFPLATGTREDILCVGRLVPYKGVATLLRAMPRVEHETGAKLTIVGDGPERRRLEKLAAELRVEARFLGRVDDETLVRLYGSHKLTVLPSANTQEAFGITLLESMACGTPVVASDLPGVREVATLGGLVAPPRDATGLAIAIARAYSAPGAFGSPSDIRARIAADHAWSAVVERLEAVYERARRDHLAARAAPDARRTRAPAGGAP